MHRGHRFGAAHAPAAKGCPYPSCKTFEECALPILKLSVCKDYALFGSCRVIRCTPSTTDLQQNKPMAIDQRADWTLGSSAEPHRLSNGLRQMVRAPDSSFLFFSVLFFKTTKSLSIKNTSRGDHAPLRNDCNPNTATFTHVWLFSF